MTTVTQIARWRYVPKKTDVDHTGKCPSCEYPNRVRLNAKLDELEKSICPHFRRHQYNREHGVVEFVFET